MKSLDILLENYWIVRDKDEEKYEQVRSNITEEELSFIKHKLGYKVIVNPYIVKLEKLPGIPKAFMGINEFESKYDYVFLCLVLMFLEDKIKGEQFILSGLIEFIQNIVVDIDLNDMVIDFTFFKQRKAMVRVLKYVKSLGFIKLFDGDEAKFAENIENDALYEITGLSKYFMRNFATSISDCNTYEDILSKEELGLKQDIGIERKQRVYRRIFMENVVYNEGFDDSDYAYIKNYKNVISRDCDIFFDSSFEVYKNGAFMLLSDEKNYKNVLPSTKAISDITLLFNSYIKELVEDEKIILQEDDTCILSNNQFFDIIVSFRKKYNQGFSKEYREMENEKFITNLIKYMEEFDLLREDKIQNNIKIMPMCFRVGGMYPNAFENNDKNITEESKGNISKNTNLVSTKEVKKFSNTNEDKNLEKLKYESSNYNENNNDNNNNNEFEQLHFDLGDNN